MAFDPALGFPGGSDGKESACNAGDTREAGLIPGSGKSSRVGMATHSSILAWENPWTEEPGGLRSMGPQRVGYDSAHTHKEVTTFIL